MDKQIVVYKATENIRLELHPIRHQPLSIGHGHGARQNVV